MKINKYLICSVLIAFILFIIPFFWLKPGEMDIGGDSTRLFFYDPISYLKTQILYGTTTSGIGGEAASYFVLPFIILLAVIKFVVSSPTIVIAVLNGIKLSIGYIICYFILKELAGRKSVPPSFSVEVSSMLAGAFYVLAPPLIYSGWERSILSHIQIFINPLIFLLLLKYLNTNKKIYLICTLLITFIFSSNFSYFAAPGFFAFFPLTIIFLFIYQKYINLQAFPYKPFFVSCLVFLLLQLFHLGPHILSLVTVDSDINKSVFAPNTIFNLGLDYFVATAANIKVSISLFGLAQLQDITIFSFGYVLFPLLLLVGIFKGKSKLLLITAIFFLITLFFVTANITDTGFLFYKLLFRVPGFKMFRNFYGQWVFVYIFFFALLLGQSLVIVINGLKKIYINILVISIILILINSAFPLLSGSITHSINTQSKNIKQSIVMDPSFEQVINSIRSLPIDGKILSFPFTGPGYQLFAGKDGGAYVGPSTFSYLAGKNDFTGYAGMGPYGQKFIEYVRNKDFDSVNNMMALLNIKYIFYNSDPYIYDDNFPAYPYDFIRDYMPKTQDGYKKLLTHFPIDQTQALKQGLFNLYPIQTNYLPHIYTTSNLLYATFPDTLVLNAQLNQDIKNAVFDIKESKNTSDSVILEAEPDNPLQVLQDNYHLHHHEPFVSIELKDYFYPLVLVKEKFQLWRSRRNHDRFLDFSLYFLTKRILELQKWGEALPVISHPVPPPKIGELFSIGRYNSWEASLSRYESGVNTLNEWINKNKLSDSALIVDKIKISEQFVQHKNILYKLLQNSQKKAVESHYLQGEIDAMFFRLYKTLNLMEADPSLFAYNLQIPDKYENSTFDAFIQYDQSESSPNLLHNSIPIQMELDGQKIEQKLFSISSKLQKLGTASLKKTGLTHFFVTIPKQSVDLRDESWSSSGYSNQVGKTDSLLLLNTPGDNSGGLVRQIKNWAPRKQFVITFDYNTHGSNVIFRLFDKVSVNEDGSDTRQHVYSDHSLSSYDWSSHQLIVYTDAKSTAGYIQFLNNTKNTNVKIDIRNLSIVEINYPKIFFVKKSDKTTININLPIIKFTKINPTKYQVDITNARNPYVLIFLEAYHAGWKLTDISTNASGLYSGIMRSLGRVLLTLSKVVSRGPVDDQFVAAEYFDGTVAEGKHVNSFFDKRNFLSWGKEIIAANKHKRVNGYANAWAIEPADVQSRSAYTLILETSSQNYFYIYLVVSCLTFFGILAYAAVLLFRKQK